MKLLNFFKNVALTLTTTELYCIWSKKELHEVSTAHMWMIIIAVAIIFFCLLRMIDKEVYRAYIILRKKKNKRAEIMSRLEAENANEKTSDSTSIR